VARRDFFVYALKRRTTGEVFYIGKGHGRRWRDHVRPSNDTHAARIIRKHKAFAEIVWSGLTEDEAFFRERFLIADIGRLDTDTGPLANKTAGGEGRSGAIVSAETRAKLSAANLKRYEDPAERAKTAATSKVTMKAQWSNPSERKKRVAAMQVIYVNPEYGAKIGAAMREKWNDEEYRTKTTDAIRATHTSPEYCAKLGAAVRAAMAAPEVRAKIRAVWDDPAVKKRMIDGQKATKSTPEGRAKASAAQQARYARDAAFQAARKAQSA
jgi:hypothetical protein